MDTPVIEEVLQEWLQEHRDWSRQDKRIRKRFRFKTFPESIQFVNQVAEIAEEHNHHPFIQIDFRVVTLELTSWHARGITVLDLQLADKYDALVED
ncbi:4a-hydroxytetrahydrobiopterin dehydratase [Alicyclobacillus tolerans]|uniref:4a-hydroxytetrahydrobiopterin dehydratase n=1 Tax=Alicyclobacillus tolerans TaxID=90970 RepID=A0A1M6LZR6_9BACL|nr:4a-hydroxytetrahydrobiopterin dehydratase [Alicyclobacillus montanus]SHJ76759.1 4a-hydroxytetrahydrobiopterin dehydratase [Alicyclobacillus montanus]